MCWLANIKAALVWFALIMSKGVNVNPRGLQNVPSLYLSLAGCLRVSMYNDFRETGALTLWFHF